MKTPDYVEKSWQKGNRERLKCFAREPFTKRNFVQIGYYLVSAEDMRLAFKRHHYGRSHGTSLRNLVDVYNLHSDVNKFQARIISDKLYFHREIRTKICPATLAEQEKWLSYPGELWPPSS